MISLTVCDVGSRASTIDGMHLLFADLLVLTTWADLICAIREYTTRRSEKQLSCTYSSSTTDSCHRTAIGRVWADSWLQLNG